MKPYEDKAYRQESVLNKGDLVLCKWTESIGIVIEPYDSPKGLWYVMWNGVSKTPKLENEWKIFLL